LGSVFLPGDHFVRNYSACLQVGFFFFPLCRFACEAMLMTRDGRGSVLAKLQPPLGAGL